MNLEQARSNMVEQQIRTWEVLDQEVLELLYVVPREAFVPEKHRALAFSDLQIPIGEGERMWEPKLEARVLQEMHLKKTDRVLEVGTGSGYLTALLAHRAGRVHSVEIKPGLAQLGRRNLERHGADNVTLETGDGARGWPDHAPYDAIVLTGSAAQPIGTLREFKESAERAFLVGKLREHNWNISKTAEVIGTPRSKYGYTLCPRLGIVVFLDGNSPSRPIVRISRCTRLRFTA